MGEEKKVEKSKVILFTFERKTETQSRVKFFETEIEKTLVQDHLSPNDRSN